MPRAEETGACEEERDRQTAAERLDEGSSRARVPAEGGVGLRGDGIGVEGRGADGRAHEARDESSVRAVEHGKAASIGASGGFPGAQVVGPFRGEVVVLETEVDGLLVEELQGAGPEGPQGCGLERVPGFVRVVEAGGEDVEVVLVRIHGEGVRKDVAVPLGQVEGVDEASEAADGATDDAASGSAGFRPGGGVSLDGVQDVVVEHGVRDVPARRAVLRLGKAGG